MRGVDVQAQAAKRVLADFPEDDEAAGAGVMAGARDYESLIPEVLLRQAGKCPHQTAYGHKGVTSVEFCGRKAKPGNWYGECPRHERQGIDEHGIGYWAARDRAVQDVSAAIRGFHQAADESADLGDPPGTHLAPRCPHSECRRYCGHSGPHRPASSDHQTGEQVMTEAPNYGIQNAGAGNIHFDDSPITFGSNGPGPGTAAPPPAGPAARTSPSTPISNTGPGEVTFSGERMSFGSGGMQRGPGQGSRWADAPGGRTAPTGGGSGGGSEYAEFGDLAAVRRFAQEIDSLGDGSDFVQVIKACHGLADAIRDFGGDMNLRTRAFVDAAIAVATSGDALRDEAAIVARLSKDLDGGE